MAIGPRVRERRKELGFTQEQLASQTGVTLSAVQRLEGGRITDPHYSTLLSVANALQITVAELVGEESEASAAGKASAPRETGRQVAPEAMPGTSGHAHHVQIAEDSGGTRVEYTKTSFFELMRDVKEGRLSEEDAWQRFQAEAG